MGTPTLRRTVRLLLALAFFALVAGFSTLAARPAAAASDDTIDSFRADYSLKTSGALQVRETIVYRFGAGSGRHGIDRYLVTREKYDNDHDAVYGVSGITVSSPTGAPTTYTTATTEDQGGRERELRIRIGDPNRTVSADTATYVIDYTVAGAVRTSGSYDELYWDATGFGWKADIRSASLTATVPGGAQGVLCYVGPPGSKTSCSTDTTQGDRGVFGATNIAAGDGMTFSVKIKPGLVSDNRPQLEPNAAALSPAQKTAVGVGIGVSALAAIASPILGLRWWRRNGRDQRYAGLPPGTLPLPGSNFAVVPSDPDLPIPVAFTPPPIPVAEAGLLIDGQVDTKETAATLVDLAVRRGLTLHSEGKDDLSVTLVDPSRAAAPHEVVLLSALFSGARPGSTVDLSRQGTLLPAHQAMREAVRDQVAARGWFRKVPSAGAAGGLGFGALVVLGFFLLQVGAALLWILVPLAVPLLTVLIIRRKLRRGQRTPVGRAVCDQVEGFKIYLATAEAEQLRFEEGEDIFSRYLPWAIAFDLADRWERVCAELVRIGRLPDVTPYWYSGYGYGFNSFNLGFLTGSLASAATPVPSSGGSSGTGFGGGSAFSGGGGFAGGGGGGGGGGSW